MIEQDRIFPYDLKAERERERERDEDEGEEGS